MHHLRKWVTAVALLALAGCKSDQVVSHSADKPPGEFHRVEGAGIENFYALGDNLYSGSAPEGDEGFETLKQLGVKTLISVDGSAPEADLAAKHGLRYIHIPVGYDGIATSNAFAIAKAAQTLPGPIFIHCHHGQHRGPTAAAVICESLQGWTPEQAEAWLRAAGTSTNYPGLYRTVREFTPPTTSELRHVSGKFTSRAATPDLVQTMVQIDGHFDTLIAFQKAGFKPLADHPDATPVNESLQLYELFREAHRTKEGSKRGERFLLNLSKAETTADTLHSRLKDLEASPTTDLQPIQTAFQNMTATCNACHKAYRN